MNRFVCNLGCLLSCLVLLSSCSSDDSNDVEEFKEIAGEWALFSGNYIEGYNFKTSDVYRCVYAPGYLLNEYNAGVYTITNENVLDIGFYNPEHGVLYSYFLWNILDYNNDVIVFKDGLYENKLYRINGEWCVQATDAKTVSLSDYIDTTGLVDCISADETTLSVDKADWSLKGISAGVTFLKLSFGSTEKIVKVKVEAKGTMYEALSYIKTLNALKESVEMYYGSPDMLVGGRYVYLTGIGKIYLFFNEFGLVDAVYIYINENVGAEEVVAFLSEKFEELVNEDDPQRSYFMNGERNVLFVYDKEGHFLVMHKE